MSMDYKKIYNNLIERARDREYVLGYYESHHIIPRCMGGTNDKENLVNLTPEEHYVAHQLLTKIYPNNHKLVNAAVMMIPNRPSNKLYGWLKRRLSITKSFQQTGKKNSQYNMMWIHNRTLRENKKIKKTDFIPEGWCKGRILNFDKPIRDLHYDYKAASYERKKEETKKLANNLFEEFKKSDYNSICAFAKANNTTQPRLCILWKKYVDEYNQKRKHGKSFKD
jgi:hypothetical protein